jgi:hypothetical protein
MLSLDLCLTLVYTLLGTVGNAGVLGCVVIRGKFISDLQLFYWEGIVEIDLFVEVCEGHAHLLVRDRHVADQGVLKPSEFRIDILFYLQQVILCFLGCLDVDVELSICHPKLLLDLPFHIFFTWFFIIS